MIFCVDLDSTLLRSDKKLSDYTIKVFNEIKDDHLIVINSARNQMRIYPYSELINCKYIIANGGSLIFDDKLNLLYKIAIDKEIVKKLTSELINECEYFSVQAFDNLYKSIDSDKFTGIYTDDFNYDAYKIIVYKASKNVSNIASKYGLEYICYENGPFGKISLKEVTKYSGLVNLLKLIDKNLDDVVYFGDDIGDLECLLKCGHGVCVANSVKEVLDVVKNKCDTNDNDGVAKYINRLIRSLDDEKNT